MNFLEICCFNIQSALIAQHAGAHRVELCADPTDGGTTPGFGLIKTAREKLKIQLYPIIRPRGGDFLFNEEEFEIMLNDVSLCKQLGCDGMVIGMLNADGTIDKKRCAKLVELAYPLGVTFHRAFDRSANPFEALEDIISIGCERILTSGQKPTAIEGATLLNELIRQADSRIIIMPGSGVRANNIIELKEKANAEEFHTSARTFEKSTMQFINEKMKDDNSYTIADENEITEILQLLAGSQASDGS
jgi:copper homeostasis protein